MQFLHSLVAGLEELFGELVNSRSLKLTYGLAALPAPPHHVLRTLRHNPRHKDPIPQDL